MNRKYWERLRKQKEDRLNAIIASAENEDGTVRELTEAEDKEYQDLLKGIARDNKRIEALPPDPEPEPEGDEIDAENEGVEVEGELVGASAEVAEARSRRGRSPIVRGVTPGRSPVVHTREHLYLYSEAIRQIVDRAESGRALDGLVNEIHTELKKQRGGVAKGVILPMGNEPQWQRHFRPPSRRDLTTTTGAGGVFTVAEMPMIELIRARMVVRQLGARFISGLEGAVAIPRKSASTTPQWIAEGVAVTPSNPTVDQVLLTPKTLANAVNISRKFLIQSAFDAEEFVRTDIAESIAIELDRVAINGSGSGAQPRGVLQTTAIQTASASLQGGTNGAVLTYDDVVSMESLVAVNNADLGTLAYLTTPGLRGKLKTTQKATNQADYVFEANEINGYRAIASSQVPSNLTKGTAVGTAHAIIFGNWADLMVAQFGGMDTIYNPYTNQLSGAVTISMMVDADVAIRHNESFAVIMDALLA